MLKHTSKYLYLLLFLVFSFKIAYANISTVEYINNEQNNSSSYNTLFNNKSNLIFSINSFIENGYYNQAKNTLGFEDNSFIFPKEFKGKNYSNDWEVTGEETWFDSEGDEINHLNITKTGELTVDHDADMSNYPLQVHNFSSDNGVLILDSNCLCDTSYYLDIQSFSGNLSQLKVIGGKAVALFTTSDLSVNSIIIDNSMITLGEGKAIKNLENLYLKGSSTLNVVYSMTKAIEDNFLQAKNLNVEDGNVILSGGGAFNISDTVDISGSNSSLTINGTLNTKNLNIEGVVLLSSDIPVTISDSLNLNGNNSSLNIRSVLKTKNVNINATTSEIALSTPSNQIQAQNLNIDGNLNLSGEGYFILSDSINVTGASSLSMMGSSLQTKDLNIQEESSLELSGSSLNMSNAINMLNNTKLNLGSSLESKYLNVDGKASLSGSKDLSIKEEINIKSGSLEVWSKLEANNINIEKDSSLVLGASNNIQVFNDINMKDSSILKIDGEMKTKGLKAEGDASLDGKGSLNITEGLSLGSGSKLSIKNSVETKDLSIGEGSELTNLQNLKVAANTVMGNNSTLNVSGTMDTLGINLGDNTILSVSGVLTAGTGGINVDGKSQMRVDNIINTDSINIGKEGSLSIINEGTLNINSSLININGGVLDLTNTSANMLKAIGINNASGVLNIGSNELNLKEYNGNVNSKINLDIVKDNSGKLNVSNDFKLIDGSINLNVKDPIDYREGVSYVIVTANNVTLQGNNLFVFDDIKYQLIPQIVDGKAIEVTLKEASLKDDILCSSGAVSDYCNIAANLQSVIDNNLGNEDFNKYLSVIIADSQNRYYNILQLKPISSTTKKEINSVIAGEFNNLVMDRMYSSNLDNETEFEFNSIYKKDNSQIMEGINLWGSLGGSVATIKGDSLGGSEAGSQGMQTIEGVVGADYSFQPNIQLGLALGSGSTSGKNKEDIERFVNNSVSYSGLVYGNYKTGNYYVSNNISYTAISNDNTRDVNIPLNPKNNKESSTDGVISVINESGIFTDVGSFMKINSFIKGEYTDYTLSGYKEEGTGFGLSFNDTNYKDVIVGAGVRLIGDMQYYYSLINPMIELSYERKLNKDALNGQMSFANANSGTINITEDSYSQDKIKLKVGLDYKYSQSIGFSLKVQQEFNKQINSLGANIDMNYKF